jgi:hypothetical protein
MLYTLQSASFRSASSLARSSLSSSAASSSRRTHNVTPTATEFFHPQGHPELVEGSIAGTVTNEKANRFHRRPQNRVSPDFQAEAFRCNLRDRRVRLMARFLSFLQDARNAARHHGAEQHVAAISLPTDWRDLVDTTLFDRIGLG